MKIFYGIIYTLCLLSCANKVPVKTGLEGKTLPAFDFLLTDSTTCYNTSNVPSDKPVVLLFLSPECPHCRAQIRSITKEIEDLKNIQFLVLTNWPFKEMKGFFKEFELDRYSNIIAGVDYSNFFLDYFQPPAVPFLAIYGKSKKLNEAFVGMTQIKQIRKSAFN